jgi:hypothetical protein
MPAAATVAGQKLSASVAFPAVRVGGGGIGAAAGMNRFPPSQDAKKPDQLVTFAGHAKLAEQGAYVPGFDLQRSVVERDEAEAGER